MRINDTEVNFITNIDFKKQILFIALSMVLSLVICGAVSAGTPLQKNQTGTVSGDLYVNASDVWSQTTGGATNVVTQANTLPSYTSIASAYVYVNVYSGSGSNNWPVRTTVKLDGNGDGDYDDAGETLGVEDMNIPGSPDDTVYWLNDHCMRVYSDYQVWYDVTGLITSINPKLYVKTENMGGDGYDGRIKMLALCVAYNDGDSDQVHYWVLNGQDWINAASSPSSSIFNTNSFNGQVASATLNTVALSSTDGTYSFNGNSLTGNLVETGSYYKEHSWDVKNYINSGADSTLTYNTVGASFKINLATLTIRKQVAPPSNVDLTISGLVNTVPSSAVFAKETNAVTVSGVKNNGTDTATNIVVKLYASDVDGGTTAIAETTIASLAGGATAATINFTDPTIRNLEGGTVTYTAKVDPDNLITETDETNNNKDSTAKPLKYNGYKGKRYWTGGSDINTKQTYDLRGDIIYYTQPASAYQGVGWTNRTETWNAANLPVPSTGTIQDVWLFLSYNWDTTPGDKPSWTVTLNGNPIDLSGITPYTDQSNFGTYANYKYGLYMVNVTSLYNPAGDNTLVMTPNSGNSQAIYPSTLAVIYSDPNKSRKQIFIGAECDELAASQSSYGTTPDEATAYANFTGMTIDTSNVSNATLHSFAGSAGPNEGNLLWNGASIASNAWQGNSSTSSAQVFDVKNNLTATGNNAGIQGNQSGGMLALQQFLVVEYADAAPVADFSGTPTSGTAPLNVVFTDASTGTITGYAWDFDNNGTTDSTLQNPSYTYNTPGTYTVKLTVTGPGGSDDEIKTDYITVNTQPAPVAAFTATPLVGTARTVNFTDQSTNTPTSWKWEYNAGSGWTEFSTAQNPSYYFDAGAYDIRLIVTNSGGSDDETKLHYVAVATGREPLTTIQSGTVSGDLYVSSPTTWPATEVTNTFTLPSAAVGNIQWAKLYVNTYSGSAANTYQLISTVKIDANGDGDYDDPGEILGVETMDLASETNGNSYPLNDHVTKVYSDYEAQYDVTSLITASNPTINVKSEAISGKSFDGRIKGVTLVVAYNDGDADQVYYWINHGHDWSSPANGSTTFNTAGLASGWASAESKIRQLSTSDANYTFNGASKTGGGSTPNYNGLNTWDVTSDITAGQESTLAYSKTSGSYKTSLATLKVRYVAPVAAFSGTPTSGTAPLNVAFTDASTGSITSYAWDFDNNGTTDSTLQNPSYTYNTPGTYTVKLTVTGPGGSDDEVKTDYITVGFPDLVSSDMQVPSNPVLGTNYSVSAIVTNNGNVDAAAFTVKLYDNNIQVAKITIAGLASSMSIPVNFSWIPQTIGSHVLAVLADANSQITESNESNNRVSGQVTVSQSTLPDLTVSNLQLPSNPVAGNTYQITVTVTNNGTTDAAAFSVKLYDNNVQVAKINLAGLAAGASLPVTFNWTPTAGTHNLLVKTDANNQITESNENNNQISGNITVSQSTLPDLTVSNLQLPSNPVAGNTYQITVTVTNNGTTDAAAFSVKLYDNNVQVAKINLAGLAAKASLPVTFNWTPTAGTHNLLVKTDANNQITESNENNNTISEQSFVQEIL